MRETETRRNASSNPLERLVGLPKPHVGLRISGSRGAVRAEQAHEFGDKGLSAHLKTIVEKETSHYEETEKILRGWAQ